MDIVKYVERVGTSISVLLNVVLGGYSNQTFSARNYELKRQGKLNLVFLIDGLFFWNSDHCLRSWTYWIVRKDINK